MELAVISNFLTIKGSQGDRTRDLCSTSLITQRVSRNKSAAKRLMR